ncbi:MAG: hypothetical protein FWD68_09155 [Alphaproteobacteria bacterium]|nr:hypothetical protein [Alphaproteobacteria bacterium]
MFYRLWRRRCACFPAPARRPPFHDFLDREHGTISLWIGLLLGMLGAGALMIDLSMLCFTRHRSPVSDAAVIAGAAPPEPISGTPSPNAAIARFNGCDQAHLRSVVALSPTAAPITCALTPANVASFTRTMTGMDGGTADFGPQRLAISDLRKSPSLRAAPSRGFAAAPACCFNATAPPLPALSDGPARSRNHIPARQSVTVKPATRIASSLPGADGVIRTVMPLLETLPGRIPQ